MKYLLGEKLHFDWKVVTITIVSTLLLMVDYYHLLTPTKYWDRVILYLIIPLIVTIFEDGHVLTHGTITGDELTCELSLYQPEFLDCMEARDNGADSLTIGQHVYTWSVQ